MTIDERLQFLVQSTESLQQSCQQLHATTAEHTRQIDELCLIAARHDQELRRFHRAMRAALQAWLNGDGDEGETR